jgi:hypothetical protein
MTKINFIRRIALIPDINKESNKRNWFMGRTPFLHNGERSSSLLFLIFDEYLFSVWAKILFSNFEMPF